MHKLYDTCKTKTDESMCSGSISCRVSISFINALVLLDLQCANIAGLKSITQFVWKITTLDPASELREKLKHEFPIVWNN